MNNGGHHRVNTPAVIHQLIDGEVVVINLDTGHYYSLTETAARIWVGVEAGGSTDEITAQCAREFSDCPSDHSEVINRFIGELRAENLIVPIANGNIPHGSPMGNGVAGKRVFVAPEFKKFTDMRELLLLDPVHEVGETGWPHLPGEKHSGNHENG